MLYHIYSQYYIILCTCIILPKFDCHGVKVTGNV